jgi:hypothetical protein
LTKLLLDILEGRKEVLMVNDNSMKTMLNNVKGTLERLSITKMKNTSDFFLGRLEVGRPYEERLKDVLERELGLPRIKIDENEDGRFDFQVEYEDIFYTIECKGHPSSITYGNINLVVKEKDKYKPWILTSDLYCGFYWEDKILYSSYISVKDIRINLKNGVWDKYKKKGNIGWNSGECIYFHIPTKVFREACGLTMEHNK